MESFVGEGIGIVRLALDAAILRHQTIAANMANVNTAGYTPLKVNFEEQLAAASFDSGKVNDLSGIQPFVEQESAPNGLTPQSAIDMEIVKLNLNTLHYQALLKATNMYFSVANAAVTEGGR